MSQLEQEKKNLASENRRILTEKEELANEKVTLLENILKVLVR